MGYAKKRKKKKIHARGMRKNGYKSVQIIKQWVLRYPPEKRKKREERNKIAHAFQRY
jgi:hypothetical protein